MGASLSTGCASSIAPHCDGDPRTRARFGDFDDLPRARLGCLPFPGLFTLYQTADPAGLGDHAYAGDTSAETDRGIVYTCRAGFIDVCHVRNAADMTAYVHARFRHAFRNGWTCLRFRGHEPSAYTVEIHYPDFWDDLSPAERRRVGDEAAVRASQQIAMAVMTWHELLTWYGYKSTVLISEKGSAFTYEDSTSHAVGVLIAGEALRAGGDYNEAVTAALDRLLLDLQAVDDDGLNEAIQAVKGDWWDNGSTRKRHLEAGLPGSPVEPWTVAGLSCCDDADPAVLSVPTLADVDGHNLQGVYSLAIDPRVLEGGKIRARLNGSPDRIDPARDFPVLIADIRDTIGVENTRPDPDAVVASDQD